MSLSRSSWPMTKLDVSPSLTFAHHRQYSRVATAGRKNRASFHLFSDLGAHAVKSGHLSDAWPNHSTAIRPLASSPHCPSRWLGAKPAGEKSQGPPHLLTASDISPTPPKTFFFCPSFHLPLQTLDPAVARDDGGLPFVLFFLPGLFIYFLFLCVTCICSVRLVLPFWI